MASIFICEECPRTLDCIVCCSTFQYDKAGAGRLPRFCSVECKAARKQHHAKRYRGERRYLPKPRVAYIRRICIVCYAEFVTYNQCTKTCGRVCGKVHGDRVRVARVKHERTRTCKRCGARFVMGNPSGIARKGKYKPGQYCSRRCAGSEKFFANKREQQKAQKQRRRAACRGQASERVSASAIYERDGWRCGLCGTNVSKRLRHPHPMSVSLDHIVPLARGGSHTRDNVQCAHLQCNVAKGATLEGQMLLFG